MGSWAEIELFWLYICKGLFVIDSFILYSFEIANLLSGIKLKANLWHCWLGYTNYKDLEALKYNLISIEFVKRPKKLGEEACVACLAGKIKELFTRKTDNQIEIRLRRLYIDASKIKETLV